MYARKNQPLPAFYRVTQRGSALITALLITAIAATIATMLIMREQSLIQQTQLIFNADRAYSNLQGVEDWAIATLGKNNSGQLAEIFPITMPTTTFRGAQISGVIQDQLGLFNLNSLVSANNQQPFIRLLKAAVPKMNDKLALDIAIAITHWVTPSNADEIYLKQSPPYRASHQLMVNVSELRLVAGISPAIYQKLAPFVTTLPTTDNAININSAPLPVLMSLASMNNEQANALLQCREQRRVFTNIAEFKNICSNQANITFTPGIKLVTSSDYFLLHGYVKLNKQQLGITSLLQRAISTKGKTQTIQVNVLWQSREIG